MDLTFKELDWTNKLLNLEVEPAPVHFREAEKWHVTPKVAWGNEILAARPLFISLKRKVDVIFMFQKRACNSPEILLYFSKQSFQ